MEDMYDSLEKTLSFVSPVKDGLGVSALDRTLGCDNSGELFFQELASLEAKKRAKAAGDSGRACGIKNIREVGTTSRGIDAPPNGCIRAKSCGVRLPAT